MPCQGSVASVRLANHSPPGPALPDRDRQGDTGREPLAEPSAGVPPRQERCRRKGGKMCAAGRPEVGTSGRSPTGWATLRQRTAPSRAGVGPAWTCPSGGAAASSLLPRRPAPGRPRWLLPVSRCLGIPFRPPARRLPRRKAGARGALVGTGRHDAPWAGAAAARGAGGVRLCGPGRGAEGAATAARRRRPPCSPCRDLPTDLRALGPVALVRGFRARARGAAAAGRERPWRERVGRTSEAPLRREGWWPGLGSLRSGGRRAVPAEGALGARSSGLGAQRAGPPPSSFFLAARCGDAVLTALRRVHRSSTFCRSRYVHFAPGCQRSPSPAITLPSARAPCGPRGRRGTSARDPPLRSGPGAMPHTREIGFQFQAGDARSCPSYHL